MCRRGFHRVRPGRMRSESLGPSPSPRSLALQTPLPSPSPCHRGIAADSDPGRPAGGHRLARCRREAPPAPALQVHIVKTLPG